MMPLPLNLQKRGAVFDPTFFTVQKVEPTLPQNWGSGGVVLAARGGAPALAGPFFLQ